MRERRPALLLTLPDAVGLLALIQGLGLLYVGQLAGGFFCLLLSAVFLVPHLFLIWNRRLARPGSYIAWVADATARLLEENAVRANTGPVVRLDDLSEEDRRLIREAGAELGEVFFLSAVAAVERLSLSEVIRKSWAGDLPDLVRSPAGTFVARTPLARALIRLAEDRSLKTLRLDQLIQESLGFAFRPVEIHDTQESANDAPLQG